MPIATNETEISLARMQLLPQRYKHVRQTVWQNYTDIGSHALRCGEINLAHKMFSEALAEARKEENIDYRLAVSFAHVAHTLLSQGNFSSAANTYLRALSIARNVSDAPKGFEIMILETLADVHLRQGHLRLAKRYFSRAISLREQFDSNNKEQLAKTIVKLAHVFAELEETNQAFALFEKSRTLLK